MLFYSKIPFANAVLTTVAYIYCTRQTFRVAKLLSGKTFAVGMQITIHRENFRGCLKPISFVLRETYRITYSTKICGKIFAIESKIVKIAKVFPLESFPVYGISISPLGDIKM